MKKKIIKIGLDFDGVVAYNPARLARFPISFIKEQFFGERKVHFFVPKTPLSKFVWSLAHETSMFPSVGATLLRDLTRRGVIEVHLITGRFGYLEPNLRSFLERWRLAKCFKSITVNKHEEQPHLFKERIVRAKKLDYYVEDNWDIVQYLASRKLRTKIHWIYNLFDRTKAYPYKYPYLLKALEHMLRNR
jgi:hypothetical protein